LISCGLRAQRNSGSTSLARHGWRARSGAETSLSPARRRPTKCATVRVSAKSLKRCRQRKRRRLRMGDRLATRPSSRKRSSRSPASNPRCAALSPAPMPSPSPSRSPTCRRRSMLIATYRPRSHETRSRLLRTGGKLPCAQLSCIAPATSRIEHVRRRSPEPRM
jgi:hypothetical protein